ncbi:MAG: 2-oxoacid:acceptor oxidoreductase family protein [Candidatus Bathyarchaeota archaeon]|nr:2-oxoacid:acceptor oxidoreductase family protein [Candidatus Bathyarchaeota archaeon]
MAKKIEIIIGGSGGQGVVLAGQILGKCVAYEGKKVLQTQSYGAEARGSLARSEVIISDEKIGFPAVRKCDILIAMNQESLNAHLSQLKDDGILIVDSTNVQNIPKTKAKIYKIAITETCRKIFGETTYANMIMLGALIKLTKIVNGKTMEKVIEETVPAKTLSANLRAFEKGRELI